MTDLAGQRPDALAARGRSVPQRQIECTGSASWAHSEAAAPEPRGRAPRQTLPIVDPPARAAS